MFNLIKYCRKDEKVSAVEIPKSSSKSVLGIDSQEIIIHRFKNYESTIGTNVDISVFGFHCVATDT
jgi:hypothetical protein